MDSLTLVKTAAGILDAKKADQINVIRISDVSSLGDYFVLANGTGSTHVHALADELEFKLKELGIAPDRVEGYRSDSWVVLDYETVVVHIFTSEARRLCSATRLSSFWTSPPSVSTRSRSSRSATSSRASAETTRLFCPPTSCPKCRPCASA